VTKPNRARRLQNLLLLTMIMVIVFGYLLHPEDVFYASLRGVGIWWEVVFPATLPFLIVAELAMGLGVPHFLGVFLQPWMKPLFRLPGMSSFVLTMGFASGYPMSAKLTVRMKERGYLTAAQAERLVAFTTTADPLFITAAVAVGFFQNAGLGTALLLTHYTSAIILGIILAFMYRDASLEAEKRGGWHRNRDPYQGDRSMNILHRAYRALDRARAEDGRPFGKLMADAVNSALLTTLMIGGLIIFFSVLMRIFELIGLIEGLSFLMQQAFITFHLPLELIHPLIQGVFEVTLGEQAVAETGRAHTTLLHYALASAILAWGGLSVHAQVATILSEAAIRYQPFLMARLMHSILAPTLFLMSWPWLRRLIDPPVSHPPLPDSSYPVWIPFSPMDTYGMSTSIALHAKVVWFALAALIFMAALNYIIVSFWHMVRFFSHQKNLR